MGLLCLDWNGTGRRSFHTMAFGDPRQPDVRRVPTIPSSSNLNGGGAVVNMILPSTTASAWWLVWETICRFQSRLTSHPPAIMVSTWKRCADMTIREVVDDKKRYISLLLLADEQEDMVDRYLENGTMYVLEDGGVKAECVVTQEDGMLEIKNIAVVPEFQGHGYGKALIDFLVHRYSCSCSVLQVGTGDSPNTVPFYEKCGFVRSHRIPDFFLDNYDHPIYDGGVRLVDMVYLQRRLQ